jgi:hypothetical protein
MRVMITGSLMLAFCEEMLAHLGKGKEQDTVILVDTPDTYPVAAVELQRAMDIKCHDVYIRQDPVDFGEVSVFCSEFLLGQIYSRLLSKGQTLKVFVPPRWYSH